LPPAAAFTSRDLDRLLGEAGKKPLSVYLFIGEPFQTEAAARRLIDVLVPRERRSFNLELYDGRTAALAPILDSMRTPSLFRGLKLIWVREPALFLSAEKRSDLSAGLFTAWAEERHAEAAEKLLTLAAMAGWKQEHFATVDWSTLPDTAMSEVLGQTADADERAILGAVRNYCVERNLSVADFRDESGLLQELLQGRLPPDAVLLFTATAVDRRKRVVNAIREHGAVVELTLARERSGALAEASVAQLVAEVIGRAGKRLSPAAERLIVQRAGSDAAAVAMELEKLCLYAGDAGSIGEDDVRASFRDMGESWIFDFTSALSRRQVTPALRLLRVLFEQGEHPLRLVALIARELRILLLARDCLGDTLATQWKPGMPYAAFRDRLLPLLSEEQREALGGIHPYALYQSLQNASHMRTSALQAALLALHAIDLKLKSSQGNPHILLERFVLDLCRT
jgi:DNA polymerase-3 subunit delta